MNIIIKPLCINIHIIITVYMSFVAKSTDQFNTFKNYIRLLVKKIIIRNNSRQSLAGAEKFMFFPYSLFKAGIQG